MSVLQIALSASQPAYSFEIDLEGVTYLLGLAWNARQKSWHLSLSFAGVLQFCTRLTPNVFLVAPFRGQAANLPPGDMQLYCATGQEAGFSDLGTASQLYYVEAADLAAADFQVLEIIKG